jgi:hypothetical protein
MLAIDASQAALIASIASQVKALATGSRTRASGAVQGRREKGPVFAREATVVRNGQTPGNQGGSIWATGSRVRVRPTFR